MNQPWKVVLSFAAIFIAGMMCGGPVLEWVGERLRENRPPFAERTMQRFVKEFNLTEEQKQKIEPILLRTQRDWRQHRQDNMRNLMSVIDRMHADVAAELTPEQRGRLTEISNEFRARAESFRGRIREQESAPAEKKSGQ